MGLNGIPYGEKKIKKRSWRSQGVLQFRTYEDEKVPERILRSSNYWGKKTNKPFKYSSYKCEAHFLESRVISCARCWQDDI